MRRYLLTAALIAGCQRLTDPAGYHFAEAQALTDAGEYDDAVVAFEAVAKDYPASPEAGKVPRAVADVNVKRAKVAWGDEKFLDAGRFYRDYARVVGPDEAVGNLAERDPAMFFAITYALHHDEEPLDDKGLMWVTDFSRRTTEEVGALAPFVREIAGWACETRAKFPAWKTCSEVVPDVEDGIVVAAARAERAVAACSMLNDLAPSCTPEVGAEIAALSGSLATLRSNIAAERAPLDLTYDNMTGTWDCRVVVWEFTPLKVGVGELRLAKRMTMTGSITNMGYAVSDGDVLITDGEDTNMIWTSATVSKGELLATGVRTAAGLAEGEWRCLRVNDTSSWKPKKLWETE